MFVNNSTQVNPSNPMQLFMSAMFAGPDNFNNPSTQIINNNSWMSGYTASQNIPIKNIPHDHMMYNCIFKATQGQQFNIPFSEERTVEDLIKTFFKRVDLEEEYAHPDKLVFLYSAQKINYNEKKSIKDYFRTNSHPSIMVIDVQNLIGA